MKYKTLVEQTIIKDILKEVDNILYMDLVEDVDSAFRKLISGESMKSVKDEINKDVDQKNIEKAYIFYHTIKNKLENGEIKKDKERVKKFKEWAKILYNTYQGQMSDERAKELVIQLKKTKGFKGNILGVN